MPDQTTIQALVDRTQPGRRIHGVSAVFLPFDRAGQPDLEAFTQHLARTHRAGLEPAVNMDTGFGPQLTPRQRESILRRTRDTLGPTAPFVAGAMPFGEDDDPLTGYRRSVERIVHVGATPIVFPSELFASADGREVARLHRQIIEAAPRALAFELGEMFAPFGRIYDLETIKRLLDIPNLAGLKHSSLRREPELQRLELRDRLRPDFRIYTGNDLAIDMVQYGSDYVLGLSTFEPEAFALRDRLWAAGDVAFFALNDALQTLGRVAFREPVPAYKASAAVYLRITGGLEDPHAHPDCPRRPAWEGDMLGSFALQVAAAVATAVK